MNPIPRQPNLPTPTNCFGKPYPIAQWYECPHCKKQSPMVREWVGLTDEDLDYCNTHSSGNTEWMKKKAFARAIEAKLKEKNA